MWQKGPLPADTWGWGGVVPVGEEYASGGFFFADFCGDKVKILTGKGPRDQQGFEVLLPHDVAWYDNSLTLPPGSMSRASRLGVGRENV